MADLELEVEVQVVLVAKKAELELEVVEEEEVEKLAHSSGEGVAEDKHVRLLFSTSWNMASTALLGCLRAWW